jgi:anthranilate synthase/aminodeoxychorismate synthase-like glutamine amidotransferase
MKTIQMASHDVSKRVLVLDNYDSFTYNLAQLIGALGAEPVVVRNDMIDLNGIAALAPTHIIVSPGPGRPSEPRDFGICGAVLLQYGPTIPTLGVCLGHQGIVHYLGGSIVKAPSIMHGKRSRISHDGSGLFAKLPTEMEVMRYHSLIAARALLPACLRVIAQTVDDALVMAVAHESWPMIGVQFHPESIGTPNGHQLMANFLGVAV